jgi:hypothetical protein
VFREKNKPFRNIVDPLDAPRVTTKAVPRCSSLDLPGLLSTMTVDVSSSAAAEADLPYEFPHPTFHKLNTQNNVQNTVHKYI